MWFTVCPIDPNLPPIPPPVHYKQPRNHVENLLSMFKLKTWSLGSISTGTVKASSSMSGGLQDVGVSTLRGLKYGSKGSKAGKAYSQEFLDMLESKLEETGETSLTRHTINVAKLAKLRSIVDVLRDTAGDTDDASDTDSTGLTQHNKQLQQHHTVPEFVKVFDTTSKSTDMVDPADPKTIKKRRKRTKPSKKLGLRALLENSPDVSSDSGDNLDDDGPPSSTFNKTSMAWLQSRKMEMKNRPLSDSFHTIPRLRESLNAGKMNKVSNYSFDDHSPEKERSQSVSNADLSTTATSLAHERSHVTSKDSDSERHKTPSDIQVHYTVMDNRPNTEEDSPLLSDPKFSSPVCKYYSVPIEISLHRISVIDVDKPPEMEILRTKSFGTDVKRPKEGSGVKVPVRTDDSDITMSNSIQFRSRSLGELDYLESDDEVLVVRAPVANFSPPATKVAAPQSAASSLYSRGRVASVGGGTTTYNTPRAHATPRVHSMSVGGASGGQEEEEVDGEMLSSLDFTSIRRQVDHMTAAVAADTTTTTITTDYKRTSAIKRDSYQGRGGEHHEVAVQSWQDVGERGGEREGEELVRKNPMAKARSLDNLMDDTLPRSKK